MKIIDINSLALPEVKVIHYGRFPDDRGYFSEVLKKSDFDNLEEGKFFGGVEFVQINEAYSKAGTVRGLHFQWDLPMGKLIRTIRGHMIDIIMDIRQGSPNLGKIIMNDMPVKVDEENNQLLWIPPGFAHGNFFPEESMVEYFCTSEYNPSGEGGISPLSTDFDWSLCDPKLKEKFEEIVGGGLLISQKDKDAQTLKGWLDSPLSKNFTV